MEKEFVLEDRTITFTDVAVVLKSGEVNEGLLLHDSTDPWHDGDEICCTGVSMPETAEEAEYMLENENWQNTSFFKSYREV